MSNDATESRSRRNPAPFILAGLVVLLALYYAVLGLTGSLKSATSVPVQDNTTVGKDYLTLQLRTQEFDLTNRTLLANIMPIPHGKYVGSKPGEMSKSLRIEAVSGGTTTSVVTFPGESIVDPTALSLLLDRGDSAYPLDKPYADFQLSVQDDNTGEAVPFQVQIDNSARPWQLGASLGQSITENKRTLQSVTLEGKRDALSISLVAFYVIAILLTTLIAVVTVGTAIMNRSLEFSNVIWLSATMLSFPTLRSAMPGAPPIGTTMDFIVFFPCIVLVAAMLVLTGAHLLWRESGSLRRFNLDKPEASPATKEELATLDA